MCLSELLEKATQGTENSDETYDKAFYCPECQTMHNHLPLNRFPKNLALLNMKKETKVIENIDSIERRTSSSHKNSTPDKSNRSRDDESVPCTAHFKKIEAYCMMCKQVL